MTTKPVPHVEFDVSLLPVGHELERAVKIYSLEEQRLEPRELKPISFKGRVRGMVSYGTPFGWLFQEGIDGHTSLTIDEEMALANAYLSTLCGLWKPTEDQLAYLNHKFDRIGYGNILQTIVDFDAVGYDNDEGESVRALKKRKDSDRRVLLINRPDEVVTEDTIIVQVKGGERVPTIWPEPGYVGRTPAGAYTSRGVPILTLPTREEAEATWPHDTEANIKFAKDAVSHVYVGNEGQGKAFVICKFFDRYSGRFELSTFENPSSRCNGSSRNRGLWIGRSPVIKQ